MADRNQSRIADNGGFADDDPFAELTRIMGFDPREPAKPQETVSAEEATDKLVSADDFGIDLEKELMGEFGGDDTAGFSEESMPDPVAQVVEQPFDDVDSITDFDKAIASSLDDDFNFDDMAVSQFEESLAESEQEPAHDFAPVQNSVPEAVQSSLGQDSAIEQEAFAAEPLTQTSESQFSSDEMLDDGDFDELASVEFDQADLVEDVAPVESLIGDEFDADIGLAMADVDMDFDAQVTEAEDPAFATATLDDENGIIAQEDAMTVVKAGVSSITDAEPATGELNEAPQLAAEISPEDQIDANTEHGTSLEDELNALLNRMSARVVPTAEVYAPTSDMQSSPVEDTSSVDEIDMIEDTQQTLEAPSIPQVDDIPVDATELAGIDEELFQELQLANVDPHPDDDQSGLAATGYDEVPVEETMYDVGHVETVADLPQSVEADAAEDQVVSKNWLADKPDAIPEEPSRLWSRGTPFAQPQPVVAPQPIAEQILAEQPVAEQTEAEFSNYDDNSVTEEAAATPEPITQVASVFDTRPDIETVEVPERVASLVDDLDIPELAFESETTEVPGFDDLDAEFSNLITGMNTSEPTSVPTRATTYDDDAYDADFKYKTGSSQADDVQFQGGDAADETGARPEANDFNLDALSGGAALAVAKSDADDAFDYDPDLDGSDALAGPEEYSPSRPQRNRGLMVAGLFGALVVVGGLGAFAFSFGGNGEAGAPVLVKADNQPIKVKPENPGGTVIPNQDNKVYDMVANGSKPVAPEQQMLVTDAQEPVDVNAAKPTVRVVGSSTDSAAASQAPAVKSEDRVAAAIVQADDATDTNSEIVAVAPRKVRTLIVRPDGSLVPREDVSQEAPKVAATEPTDPTPQNVVSSSNQDQTGALSLPSVDAAEDVASTIAEEPAATKPVARRQSSTTPQAVPVAPQRPAEQPVDIVGEVKPDQVAAISPAATVVTSGAWSMQIASQPSVESAQTTYQNLARRYENVLGGRAVNIIKAEVAGKGTFYRVRVAAQSRNDAINLCTSYKAAGGNCFVSK